MRIRLASALASLLAALALAWLAGLAWYAAAMPGRVEDASTHTDAIVVLTGGRGRIEEGVALLRQGLAKKLFVSGVEKGVEVPELLKRVHLPPDTSDAAIALGHDAESTAANAAETAAWMQTEGFRSLRLVTSNYHMRRALLEIRHAMPAMSVIPNPVFPGAVKQARWWAWPGTLHLIAGEYSKYLAAWASLALLSGFEPS